MHNVTALAANGTYPAGKTLRFNATFSEPVFVDQGREPALTLDFTGTPRNATYVRGNGSASLVFEYTPQLGDNSARLDYNGTGALRGIIEDGAGNRATSLTLAPPGEPGSLGHSSRIKIDGIRPVVHNVTAVTPNGTYPAGRDVHVRATFSEPVFVERGREPALTLDFTGTPRNATYASGNETASLVFEYTPQLGDNSARLDYNGTGALRGIIEDGAGNRATSLTLAPPGEPGSLGHSSRIKIDGIRPVVHNVTAVTPNGTYPAGRDVHVRATFSEPVFVERGREPALTLDFTGTPRNATYASGNETASLVFEYTPQLGDNSARLDYNGTGALRGIIEDGAGNRATSLTLAPPGEPGSLGHSSRIKIDGDRPGVDSVMSPTANGTYGIGDSIRIDVAFDENVAVTGCRA